MANEAIDDLNELLALADNDLLLAIDDSESNLAIKGKKLKYVTLKNAIATALGTADIKFPVDVIAGNTTYNVDLDEDNGITLVCNTAPNDINVVIPTLPQPTVAGNEWEITIMKTGDNKLTITPPSNARIGDLDVNTAIENNYGSSGRYATIKLKSVDTTNIAVLGGFKKWAEVGGSNVWNFSGGGGGSGSFTETSGATITIDSDSRTNSFASPSSSATITFNGATTVAGVGGTFLHQASTPPSFAVTGGSLVASDIVLSPNYDYVEDEVNTIFWVYDGDKIYVDNIAGGNSAPYTTGLSVSGTLTEGNVVSANYTYVDDDSDIEETGDTEYEWYRANSDGTGATVISGATSASYTLTSSDNTKLVGFRVRVYSQTGVIQGAWSDITYSNDVISAAGAASDYDLEAEGNYTVDTETGSNGTIAELNATGASGNKVVSLPDVNDAIDIEFSSVAAGNYEIWVLARCGNGSNPTAYNGSIDISYNSLDREYTLDNETIGGNITVLGTSNFGWFKTDDTYSLSGTVTITVRANFAWCAVDAVKLKYIS